MIKLENKWIHFVIHFVEAKHIKSKVNITPSKHETKKKTNLTKLRNEYRGIRLKTVHRKSRKFYLRHLSLFDSVKYL